MNIPDKVKIGYKDYDVILHNHDVANGTELCYGTIEYEQGKINISDIYSKDLKNCTFVHECLHGIDELVEAKLTEDQVRLISKGLYNFIKDNPEVFTSEVVYKKRNPHDFKVGDEVICIVTDDVTLAPCEVAKVTSKRKDCITLEGYGDKIFNKNYFLLFNEGETK